MSSKDILYAYGQNLSDDTARDFIVSAAQPSEIIKRGDIDQMIYAIKVLLSRTEVFEGDERAKFETQQLQITSIVKTTDTITDRDLKYEVLLAMRDQVASWAVRVVNADINPAVCYTKYLGISGIEDDKPGYYAIHQRLEYQVDLQLFGVGDMIIEESFVIT